MNVEIEKTCNGYIIAIHNRELAFYKMVYFSGVRNGKNQFTTDYTHARAFKDIRNAEKSAMIYYLIFKGGQNENR